MTKTYVNGITAKAKSGQYGEFFNISINLEKLKDFANEKGYVNLIMNERREVGRYGETHTFTLNEWKPDNENTRVEPMKGDDDLSIEDIPFR